MNKNRTFLTAAMIVSCMVLLPSRSLAWGRDGHELVGKIADRHLHNKTRNAINELLQGHQFQSLSDGRLTNWADTIKSSTAFKHKFPKMSQWHYIDIDLKGKLESTGLGAFCANGDCVLGAVKAFQAILKDPAKPTQDRREALFFIAHFIGDLHQPLHCAERNNDQGGNFVQVFTPSDERHTTNLHKVWDTELVDEAVGPLTLVDYASRLSNSLSLERRKAFQKGSVEDWIMESNKIAREKAYKDKGIAINITSPPTKLSDDYMIEGAEIVEEQLTKGGVRLAQFLNDTFKN